MVKFSALWRLCRERMGKARPLVRLGVGSILYPTARVINSSHDPERISIGTHSHIRGELFLFGHGGRISIGDYCYVGEQTRVWSGADITIGNRVLIAHLVTIMDNLTHPLDPAARHAHFRAIIESGHPRDLDLGDRPVRIEDDVWIGCNCVILRGVTIGAAAVVAAGSVITRDVPPRVVVAGNPARVIRSLDRDPETNVSEESHDR